MTDHEQAGSGEGWLHALRTSYEDEMDRANAENQRLTADLARVTAERDGAVARLTVLVDAFGADCQLDHHGFCQEHLVTKPCEIAEDRKFLAALDAMRKAATEQGLRRMGADKEYQAEADAIDRELDEPAPDMGADRLPFPEYIGADVRLPVSDVDGWQ